MPTAETVALADEATGLAAAATQYAAAVPRGGPQTESAALLLALATRLVDVARSHDAAQQRRPAPTRDLPNIGYASALRSALADVDLTPTDTSAERVDGELRIMLTWDWRHGAFACSCCWVDGMSLMWCQSEGWSLVDPANGHSRPLRLSPVAAPAAIAAAAAAAAGHGITAELPETQDRWEHAATLLPLREGGPR